LRVKTCNDYDYVFYVLQYWGQRTIHISDGGTIEKVGLQRRLKTTKHWLENLTQSVRTDVKIILK